MQLSGELNKNILYMQPGKRDALTPFWMKQPAYREVHLSHPEHFFQIHLEKYFKQKQRSCSHCLYKNPVDLVVILAAIQSVNLKVTCKIGIEGHFVRECTRQEVMVLN